MSLIALMIFASMGSFVVAGLSLAAYASMPEQLLTHADRGRYAGLSASTVPQASKDPDLTVQIGVLQDQSA